MAVLCVWDLLTLSVLVGLPLLFGIIVSCVCGCSESFNDYLFYSGRLPVIPCALSFILPLLPGILIDAPAAFYQNGICSLLLPLPAIVGFLLAALSAVHLLFPLRVLSLNDVLRQRFRSPLIGLLGCCIAFLVVILWLVEALDHPSRLLSEVTDHYITSHAATGIIVGLGAICTLTGGLRAVVWTAVGQVVVLAAAAAGALVVEVREIGGFSKVIQNTRDAGYLSAPSMTPDPRYNPTLPAAILTPILPWMFAGISPMTVQRIRALNSSRSARRAIIIACGILFLLMILCNVAGVSVVALSPCSRDTHFLRVLRKSPAPFPGLLTAGLMSGSIAAVSSTVCSLVAMTWEDLVQNFRFWGASRGQTTIIASFLGILISGQTALLSHLSHSLSLLSSAKILASSLSGAYFGLVLLAFICPQITSKAIVIAPMLALGVCLWQGFGAVNSGTSSIIPASFNSCSIINDNSDIDTTGFNGFYAIDSSWRPLLAFLITILIGVIVGHIHVGEDPESETESDYILCVCCRCCRACRDDEKTEDGMEDFDFLPHGSICPVHSRTNINIDDATMRTEIIPMRTSTS